MGSNPNIMKLRNKFHLSILALSLLSLPLIISCSEDDPSVPNDNNNDREELPAVTKDDVAKIKEAWEDKKVVSDYYQMEGIGWFIIFMDGTRIEIKNEETILDIFTDENQEEITFVLSDGNEYTFLLKQLIPQFNITTPSAITSKDYWTGGCRIQIANSRDYNDIFEEVEIKGRGNSTWGEPKKPYAIKLDKKKEVLGFPKHKRWVLLANYYDKSNLRTEIAFNLSRLSAEHSKPGMKYTPRTRFVTLTMNGQYQGLYQLTEQLKIDDNRVDVGDDGFLVEIDYRAYEDPENIIFRISHIPEPLVIKDPDVIKGDDNYNYVKDFIQKADDALFSDNFKDDNTGYKKYIDIPSFIDWFLVNEITKNNDSSYYTSCYMNLSRDGKLKMGPVWDFDLSIGNYPSWWTPNISNINSSSGFFLTNVKWYARMMEDPSYVAQLKERFNFYYTHKDEIFDNIERQKQLIAEVLKDNERKWMFYTNPYNETQFLEKHQKECESLRTWLEARFEWLNKAISEL